MKKVFYNLFLIIFSATLLLSLTSCGTENDTVLSEEQSNKSEVESNDVMHEAEEPSTTEDHPVEEEPDAEDPFEAFRGVLPENLVEEIRKLGKDIVIRSLIADGECPADWEELCSRAIDAQQSFEDGKKALMIESNSGTILVTIINGKVAYNLFDDSKKSNPPTITLEEYNSIQSGMSYLDVQGIIGSPGEKLSEVDLNIGSEYYTVMYQWEGEGVLGANANVTFQGDKVISKAQFGLE